MATTVTFNNTSYSIPGNREPRGWGTSLSAFLVDVAQSSLSKAGGNFTLTADANFGSNYGLVVKYIKSVSSNIAASGVVRLANTDKIAFRNNANGADLELGVSTSDRLQFGGVNVPTISSTDTLTDKTIVAANNTITTAATGNLAATELNAALAELQTDIDTRATSAAPVITGGATVRGTLLLQNTSGAQPELQLSEDPDNGTNKITIKAPATLSADYTLTLPSDDGTTSQFLQTDGNGALSWASGLSNPMTTEGDVIYGGASGAATRLAGDTTNTKKFLRSLSAGGVAAVPTWAEIDQVKGQTSGTAIGAGYVGQQLTASLSNVTLTDVAGTAKTVGTLTLTAGVWMVYALSTCSLAGTTTTYYDASISTTNNTQRTAGTARAYVNSAAAPRLTVPPLYINTTGQDVYLVAAMLGTGTTPATIGSSSEFYAVRIA